MSAVKPLSFGEQQAMGSRLRGVALSLFHYMVRVTRGGTKPIRVCAGAIAHAIHYSERQIWRGLKKLASILNVRPRFGFKRGRWSKIANEYRLRRQPVLTSLPGPPRQRRSMRPISDIPARTIQPREYKGKSLGSIHDGPARRRDAVAEFLARQAYHQSISRGRPPLR